MKSIKAKIKTNQLMLKVSQSKLNEVSSQLGEIRQRKLENIKTLKHHQKSYIDGVESLNQKRLSCDRSQLEVLERGVDYSKSQWYQSLSLVKDIEKEEKRCLESLLDAERQHKTFEKIQEKYTDQLKSELNALEQKEIDNIALKNFVSRK